MPKKGEIKNSIKGMVSYNKFGSKMIVTDDRGSHDIDVYFPEYDWTFERASRNNFKKGKIACPYEPRMFGVGYIGEGKYKMYDEYGNKTKYYYSWEGMIRRCYDKKFQEKYPTYKSCTVCEEWLNFQNFAKWYEENFYQIDGDIMHLDKDILIKGNKVYSPETCIFVPKRINILFVKADKIRGEYPIGVYYITKKDILEVTCKICKNGKRKKVYLGRYPVNQVDEAFQCYKTFKENYIKEVAEEYKELIPEKLYQAMYKWEVEITD